MKIKTNEIMTMQQGEFTNYPLEFFDLIEVEYIDNISDVKKYQREKMHDLHRRKGTFNIMSYIEGNRLHFIVPIHPVRAVFRKINFEYGYYVRFKPRAARIRKIKTCVVPIIILLVIMSLLYYSYSFMNWTF